MKNEKSITFYRIYFNLKGSMRTNPVRIFFVLSTFADESYGMAVAGTEGPREWSAQRGKGEL